ncbi:MAG: energy transducer TonB [Polaromonas sp.]|nr:energy transducer TonB [Polaromonas sp.]
MLDANTTHTSHTFHTESSLAVIHQKLTIVLTVVLLHVVFVWAVVSGLMTPQVKLVIPVMMLSQSIEPPKPKEVRPAPPSAAQIAPAPVNAQVKKAIAQPPLVAATAPPAIAYPAPLANAHVANSASANAAAGVSTQQPAQASIAAPAAAAPAVVGAQPIVQLPSSSADYLQNPLPAYPPISRRLNEQGRTMLRVLIGADGKPQASEIAKSSGFARLDDAALATVMRWRFVPGKRGGVAEAMWFNVPINWVLE